MNTKSWLLIVSMMLMVTCHKGGNAQVADIPMVKIDTVGTTTGESTLQFPGKVVASQQVNASFRVAGTLKRVCVEEGSRVKAGQLLAEMDATDYKVQLEATEAEYAQVKAEAERVMGLYADSSTTANLYDKARYGLKQMEAKLQNHRNQLAYTRITSPIDGYVQRRFFDAGETVGAGMPVVEIVSVKGLEVEVNLPASTYMQRDHMEAFSCTMDVMPDRKMPLQYAGILPQANANQLYTLRLALDAASGRIAPGMSVWVSVEMADSAASCVSIPATALVRKGDNVYAYQYDNGRVARIPVEVKALRTDGSAWVEGALHPGACVVSVGARHLTDGQEVRLLAPVSKTNIGDML